MKRLALHALVFGALLLGLVLASRELAPKPARAAAHPYIQRYVLAQGVPPAGCGASCSGSTTVFDGPISGTSASFTGVVTAGDGSAAAPAYSFAGTGSDDGIYHTADTLRFSTEGALRMSVSSIGITSSGVNFATSGTFSATTGSGGNAFACSTNGARIDYGAGASDYASSDGTTVTFAGPISVTGTTNATQYNLNGTGVLFQGSSLSLGSGSVAVRGGQANGATAQALAIAAFPSLTTAGAEMVTVYNDNGSTKKAAIDIDGTYIHYGNPTLRTCAAAIEGAISRDVLSGVATGKRTKLCLCTSDGASAYKWQNLATATLGTTTTCGTE